MVVDSASLLVALRGRIAEKPSWGRMDLLVLLAELEQEHQIPEDEFERALRMVMPQMLDLLFNRSPQLAEAAKAAFEAREAADGRVDDAGRHAPRAHLSMA